MKHEEFPSNNDEADGSIEIDQETIVYSPLAFDPKENKSDGRGRFFR